jgi:copper(I)-binding protein
MSAPIQASDASHPIRLAQAMKMDPPATETIKVGDLTLTALWARATPGGAKVAGGFVRITNIAGRFEVHEMAVTDGIMKMRPVEGGLEIKPGQTMELKPGSYHVMFMDIKSPFKEGEKVKATLQFEKAGKVDVTFAVQGVGAGAGAPAHKGH